MDNQILLDMAVVRRICAEGHKLRQKAGISLKQPLNNLSIDPVWLDKISIEEANKLGFILED